MLKNINSRPWTVDAKVTEITKDEEFSAIQASLATKLPEVSEGFSESYAQQLQEVVTTAALPPVVEGRPRMLHLTAVIVHEGVNKNGDGFVAEDLIEAVNNKKLFKMGYGGVIDVNHDFAPVGYWYDSEVVQDPQTGSTAILAKGAIWAWLYPQVADKILADQQRFGKVKVSMTCLAKAEDIVYEEDETGRLIQWNRNPVFVATTILFDQEPGDPLARGIAEEDPVILTDPEKKNTVLSSAAAENNEPLIDSEDEMTLEEIKALLSEQLGDNADNVVSEITSKLEEFTSQIADKTNELSEAKNKIQELETTVADLNTQLEEARLFGEEQKELLATANQEVESLTERVSEFEAVEAERARQEIREARLNEVSESVRARLADKPEEIREAILDRWANQTDEEWEATKAEHALASTTESKNDDRLPGAGAGGKRGIDQFIR